MGAEENNIEEQDPFEEKITRRPGIEGAAPAAPAPEAHAAPGTEHGQESMMVQALRAAGDRGPDLAAASRRYGMQEDEPAFGLVKIAVDVAKAAKTASEAADRIKESTAGVGETIYAQTVRAGNDLQSVIKTALSGEVIKTGKSLLQAIKAAADSGAQKIEQASAGIDAAARAQQAVIVRRMHADFPQAARSETKARYARSWLGIAFTLLLTLGLGACIGIGAQYLDGKVLPWGWHIAEPGARDCGTISLSGRVLYVCGATRDRD